MSSLEQPSLQTQRLLLRPFTLEDAPQVQQLASDKRIAEMVSNIPHPYPDGAAAEWIISHRPGWQEGSQASFAITDKVSDELLGAIGLSLKTSDQGFSEAEIGYWLGVDYWGKGIMSEACKRIIQFGFEALDLERIYARRLSINRASGRILEKAGLTHIGRSDGNCGDKFASLDYYELLRI